MSYRLIDPQDTTDWTCDWSVFLDDVGSPSDVISTSSWSITPQVGSPQAPDLSNSRISGAKTTIDVTGAVLGQVYRLSNTITTVQGRTKDESFTLRCDHK